MRAMVLTEQGRPLELQQLERPRPDRGQLLIRVLSCGVCRTDLHIRDGELTEPELPLVLGHEVVGEVAEVGPGENPLRFQVGDRVGVPWLGWTCGRCRFCTSGRENLCTSGRFTGYQIDGGFAEYTTADWRYCFHLPSAQDDLHAAPLLCAGLIGYRAYRMAGAASPLGLYGFGAAAHILVQVARAQGRQVFAFTRAGDEPGQAFARRLGAEWAGGSDQAPPEPLGAAILFAPAGELVPAALRAVECGGVVVCAGIHMSDIPAFPYRILWHERRLRSVANLTRRDGEEFFALIGDVPIETRVQPYPLEQAEQALADLRAGRVEGAAVLQVAAADSGAGAPSC